MLIAANDAAWALPAAGPIRWDGARDDGSATLDVPALRPHVIRVNADLKICSGSAVRLSETDDDQAIVLTNGHCGGFKRPGTYLANQSLSISITLIGERGEINVTTRRIVYATMSGTDVQLLELEQTYRQLRDAGVQIYRISREPAKAGQEVMIYSGFTRVRQHCFIDSIVPHLREGAWDFYGAYKERGCAHRHGMSGSPLIAEDTGEIVAIHNTGNDDGQSCTNNNPCEIGQDGRITVQQGAGYAQRVDWIMSCVDGRGRFDLTLSSCRLTGGGGRSPI